MEKLSQSLELVQEELLMLYEKDSDNLKDQVRQWELVKKENIILHAARRKGIMRLGYHQVPSLASSEHRAREAIEMQMYLQSLENSVFGEEPWTLQETTRERFLAPPRYCFKKEGYQVEVIFDDNRENSVSHTAWKFVYYQNGDDLWHKVPGRVEHEGLSYTQIDGLKVTFLDFAEEAKKYSQTGQWDVFVNNKRILPSSGTPPASRNTARQTRGSTTSKASPKTSSPGLRRRPAGHHLRSRGGPSRRQARGPTPPSPEEVGARTTTPSGRYSGRLGRLIQDARDPAALLLKGRPNVLKCFRFTVKQKWPRLCRLISTTFHWTASEGPQRVGEARVIIVFETPDQRKQFLSVVRFPPSISHVALNLDDI